MRNECEDVCLQHALLPRSPRECLPSRTVLASHSGHSRWHNTTLATTTACPQRFILQLQRAHARRQHRLPPTRCSGRILGSHHLSASGGCIIRSFGEGSGFGGGCVALGGCRGSARVGCRGCRTRFLCRRHCTLSLRPSSGQGCVRGIRHGRQVGRVGAPELGHCLRSSRGRSADCAPALVGSGIQGGRGGCVRGHGGSSDGGDQRSSGGGRVVACGCDRSRPCAPFSRKKSGRRHAGGCEAALCVGSCGGCSRDRCQGGFLPLGGCRRGRHPRVGRHVAQAGPVRGRLVGCSGRRVRRRGPSRGQGGARGVQVGLGGLPQGDDAVLGERVVVGETAPSVFLPPPLFLSPSFSHQLSLRPRPRRRLVVPVPRHGGQFGARPVGVSARDGSSIHRGQGGGGGGAGWFGGLGGGRAHGQAGLMCVGRWGRGGEGTPQGSKNNKAMKNLPTLHPLAPVAEDWITHGQQGFS